MMQILEMSSTLSAQMALHTQAAATHNHHWPSQERLVSKQPITSGHRHHSSNQSDQRTEVIKEEEEEVLHGRSNQRRSSYTEVIKEEEEEVLHGAQATTSQRTAG
jgi:hypothetical protein